MDEQLLRVVLPTTVLSDVDRYLASEGSTRTRADFVREAVEQRLLELTFVGDPAPAEQHTSDAARSAHRLQFLADEDADLPDDPLVAPRSLAETRLPAPFSSTVVHETAPSYPVDAGPLF